MKFHDGLIGYKFYKLECLEKDVGEDVHDFEGVAVFSFEARGFLQLVLLFQILQQLLHVLLVRARDRNHRVRIKVLRNIHILRHTLTILAKLVQKLLISALVGNLY